jgi:hypothetical protein
MIATLSEIRRPVTFPRKLLEASRSVPRGLPLVVSTIGSFLATKPNKSYEVEKSEQTYE